MKAALAALGLLLVGCATNAEILSDDWREAFDQIRVEWDATDYNCDDMAQVYRDYLHDRGAPYDFMRLVSGESVATPSLRHLWLEVWIDDEWRIFDVAAGNFNILETDDPLYASYSMARREYPGRSCLRGGGYGHYGDRYIAGRWVRPE